MPSKRNLVGGILNDAPLDRGGGLAGFGKPPPAPPYQAPDMPNDTDKYIYLYHQPSKAQRTFTLRTYADTQDTFREAAKAPALNRPQGQVIGALMEMVVTGVITPEAIKDMIRAQRKAREDT